MELTALVVFAGALLVAAGSPGPSIAALVARVLAKGPRDVLPFLAAMWVGEAVWLSLAVWGLASIAAAFQPVFAIIKWAGVLYLLYLAWKMWTAPAAVADQDLPERGSAAKMFAAGLAVTLGNPKIMVFYLALLPTIIDLGRITLFGWGELVAIMLLVLIVIDLAWVLLAARARLLLKSHRAMRIANRLSAGMIAAAASAIAVRQ
ncbi:LysE family translocator [Hoeflea sp.]|uniref:LysE family translocator n=1 Tax=Hoeflea sp. TaxID=1940281 RepID=UPI003B0205C7